MFDIAAAGRAVPQGFRIHVDDDLVAVSAFERGRQVAERLLIASTLDEALASGHRAAGIIVPPL